MCSRGHAVIDVGAQRVQRHAAFAIPFQTRDFRAAETARAVDAMPSAPRRIADCNGALHGAAEGDAALELLGDRVGDQRRVDFRLAHLDDVDDDFRVRHLGDSLRILSMSAPFLPITTPGRAEVDRDAALLADAR